MASYKDILNYYQKYWGLAALSITAASLFEVLDLLVPYAIGQILNVLSKQPLDGPVERLINGVSYLFSIPSDQTLALGILLTIILLVSVVRAPIQPWVGSWFHWAIPLRARRDQAENVLSKILTLPLAFYDEHNPGRVAGRISRGLENHTWTYP